MVAWERGNPVANFWAKVDRRGDDECWHWLAYIDADGYGHFAVPEDGRHNDEPAHRYAYELCRGEVPAGLHLDHLCHTADPACVTGPDCRHRCCVNPRHLEPVTPGENIRRAPISPGQRRAVQQRAKTHCAQGHPYDAVNTGITHEGYRWCKACDRARKVRRRAAQKK